MNKFFKSILVIFLVAALVPSFGCSKQVGNEGREDTKTQPAEMNLTLLGTSPNGPGLIIVNGLAECINKSYPDSVITVVPGNFGTNITRINNNEADACMTDTYMALSALSGEAPYDEKMDNLASVTYLMPTVYQIAVNAKSGLSSFEDFIINKKNLRISVGMTGSAAAQFMMELLAFYGLTLEDIEGWGCEIVYQNIDNSAQMLADKRIDMMVAGAIVPTPTIQEISKNKQVVLLTLEPEAVNKLCRQQKYFKYTLPAGTYDFLSEDLHTVSTNTIIAVPKNAPDEVVYKMTRAFHDNLDYIKMTHASMADITPEQMINDLGIDLHPGAEQFYREAGILE